MANSPTHRALIQRLVLTLFLLLPLAPFVAAEDLPVTEKQKIETLINQVKSLKDAKFVRNGRSYSADNAATFLKGKWDANAADMTSAQDFVDRIASFSGTSGKPYLIRFQDGKEIKCRDYLLGELKRIEAPGL